MKRILIALLILSGQSALMSSASAQVGPSCTVPIGIWSWETAPLGAFNCQAVGVEGAVPCSLQTYSCPPPAGPGETCSKCVTGGKPISLASGDTYIEETDVRVPGLSGGLRLVRIWRSMWPATQAEFQAGLFGPNWRSTFEERVFVGEDNYVKYSRGDGSFWSFGYGSPTGGSVWSVAAPANASATLTQGSTYITITFQNGEQRLFNNTSGNLVAIIDRNGKILANHVGYGDRSLHELVVDINRAFEDPPPEPDVSLLGTGPT